MARASSRSGMTLIELILVMAVLATILAISAPSLGNFFAGRTMVEESRRVYALVRYARNVAIERSIQAEAWFDPETGDYGLTAAAAEGQDSEQPVEWQLNEKLHFEIDAATEDDGRVIVRFWPDGSLDSAAPEKIGIREASGQGMDVSKRLDGFGYDLVDIADEQLTNDEQVKHEDADAKR